jgi:hypothetical protein
MKKTHNKKLSLSAEHVRVLSGSDLENAAGGVITTAMTCTHTNWLHCTHTHLCTTAIRCTR